MAFIIHRFCLLVLFSPLILSNKEEEKCKDPNNKVKFKAENDNSLVTLYPQMDERKFKVPKDKISWNVSFEDYKPPHFTSKVIKHLEFSDPIGINVTYIYKAKFNDIDGKLNRISHMGKYNVVNGFPINPVGRTGLAGRGVLARWGPNHEIKFVVTRWKVDPNNCTHVIDILNKQSGLKILQVMVHQPVGAWKWVIPTVLVRQGENTYDAVSRVFLYKILNIEKFPDDCDLTNLLKTVYDFFHKGKLIYKGYLDHVWNTDNAWMETTIMNYHDETSEEISELSLTPKMFFGSVIWKDADRHVCSWMHIDDAKIVKHIVRKYKSHW